MHRQNANRRTSRRGRTGKRAREARCGAGQARARTRTGLQDPRSPGCVNPVASTPRRRTGGCHLSFLQINGEGAPAAVETGRGRGAQGRGLGRCGGGGTLLFTAGPDCSNRGDGPHPSSYPGNKQRKPARTGRSLSVIQGQREPGQFPDGQHPLAVGGASRIQGPGPVRT